MLTEKRFIALASIYGADLRRWPDPERADAERLLAVLPAARAAMADALALDLAIDGADRDEVVDAATMARLRSGVSARIATLPPRHVPATRVALLLSALAAGSRSVLTANWAAVGLAAGSTMALCAGLWLGTAAAGVPSDGVLALLQYRPLPGIGF